jgi:hypothetical protein
LKLARGLAVVTKPVWNLALTIRKLAFLVLQLLSLLQLVLVLVLDLLMTSACVVNDC